jgi:hypothetical protein
LEYTPMRLFLSILLTSTVAAQEPAHPSREFALTFPPGWVSPARDQWTSEDGRLSVLVSQSPLPAGGLEGWAAESRKRFPGQLLGESTSLQLGGQPAWHFAGDYNGRIHRIYLTARRNTGVLLLCTSKRSQSFAAVGIVHDLLNTFRWLPRE